MNLINTLLAPNNKYEFSIEELSALYKVLEFEYVSYENEIAHSVIVKIAKIVSEHELAESSSRTA